jgi:hypothetical protein
LSSKGEKKKSIPRKQDGAALKKPLPPVKDQKDDSEAIERAVYDGMQDLRTEKPR